MSKTYSKPGDLAIKMEEKLLAEKSVEGLVFGYHFTSKIIELSNAMEVMVNSLEDYKKAIFKNQGTIEYLKKEINNLKSEIFTMKDENRHIRKENDRHHVNIIEGPSVGIEIILTILGLAMAYSEELINAKIDSAKAENPILAPIL